MAAITDLTGAYTYYDTNRAAGGYSAVALIAKANLCALGTVE